MRKITHLIVHCTATPDHRDLGFKEIDAMHKARGWESPSGVHCGYHYIVRRNGTIERGRPDVEVGAHAYGKNGVSLGIVWVGTNRPEFVQYEAMAQLLRSLMSKYDLDIDMVQGHREAVDTDKACPVINMDNLRAEIIFANQNGVKVRRD